MEGVENGVNGRTLTPQAANYDASGAETLNRAGAGARRHSVVDTDSAGGTSQLDLERRRRAFFWLCALQAVASLISGAITFAQRPHDWLVLVGIVEIDPSVRVLALALRLTVFVLALLIFMSFGGLRSVPSPGIAVLVCIPTYSLVRSLADGHDTGTRLAELIQVVVICLAIIALRPRIDDLKILGAIGVAVALL
jgi:hypothetical protein